MDNPAAAKTVEQNTTKKTKTIAFFILKIPINRLSISVLVDESLQEGEDYNLHVKPKAPVANIIQIVVDAFFNGGVASKAVHLRPARYPSLHLMTHIIAGNGLYEPFFKLRSFRPRPYEAHRTSYHIEELGNLVQAGLSQELSNLGNTGVVFRSEVGVSFRHVYPH